MASKTSKAGRGGNRRPGWVPDDIYDGYALKGFWDTLTGQRASGGNKARDPSAIARLLHGGEEPPKDTMSETSAYKRGARFAEVVIEQYALGSIRDVDKHLAARAQHWHGQVGGSTGEASSYQDYAIQGLVGAARMAGDQFLPDGFETPLDAGLNMLEEYGLSLDDGVTF